MPYKEILNKTFSILSTHYSALLSEIDVKDNVIFMIISQILQLIKI